MPQLASNTNHNSQLGHVLLVGDKRLEIEKRTHSKCVRSHEKRVSLHTKFVRMDTNRVRSYAERLSSRARRARTRIRSALIVHTKCVRLHAQRALRAAGSCGISTAPRSVTCG
eukprot:6184724-Pleurochrysis_carterae.AAC.3